MKLDSGDRIKVHGQLDVPLIDGETYKVKEIDGDCYILVNKESGDRIKAHAGTIDSYIGKKLYIERV